MGLFDIFRRKKRTAKPDPNAERGDWKHWFLNREGFGGLKFSPDEPAGGYVDVSPWVSFDEGGYVQSGPKRRQKLQPRSFDAMLNSARNTRNEKQRRWEGAGGRGPFPVMGPYDTNMPHTMEGQIRPGWLQASAPRNDQSGIMLGLTNNSLGLAGVDRLKNIYQQGIDTIRQNPMIKKAEGIYEKVDPYLPDVDLGDRSLGYNFDKDFWGGKFNIGGTYDVDDNIYNFGLNYYKDW